MSMGARMLSYSSLFGMQASAQATARALIPTDEPENQRSLGDMMLRASTTQGLSRLHVLSMLLPQLYAGDAPGDDSFGPDGTFGDELDCAGSDDEDGPGASDSSGAQPEHDLPKPSESVSGSDNDSDLDSSHASPSVAADSPQTSRYGCVIL